MQRKVQYPFIVFFTAISFGALAALILAAQGVPAVHWYMFFIFCAWTGFGVTAGRHRMVTHNSFRAHPILRWVLTSGGDASTQGLTRVWAAVHLFHHQTSDEPNDPHSPFKYVVPGKPLLQQKWAIFKGFLWAHVGWLIFPPAQIRLIVQGAKAATSKGELIQAVFFSIAGFLVPMVITGALEGWTLQTMATAASFAALRAFTISNVTWSTNSLTHLVGNNPFKSLSTDKSKNFWLIGLLGLGEGWHNNHHAFPRSAFHGLTWWQVDFTGVLIWVLERARLASKIIRIPKTRIEKRFRRRAYTA